MANTQDTFNGNGSNLGPFTFNFKWLESTDIKVSVDGVLKTAGTHYNLQALNYSSKDGGQVLFTAGNAPGIGTGNIRVYRDTDDEQLSATFYPGSAIRSQDLNDNFAQNLYVTQEVVNNSVNVDGSNPMQGDLDLGGNEITNIGAPTLSNSLVTKGYVDGYINTQYLGVSADNPSTRPGGSPLQDGDYYVNSAQYQVRVYYASAWHDADYQTEQDRIAAEAARDAAIAAKTDAETAEANAELAEVNAVTAQLVAEGAKSEAEAARDSAIIQAGLYEDEPTGRAAVADGEAFKVQGNGNIAAFEYRRVNATTSTLIATYPAANAHWSIREDLEAAGIYDYTGSGPTYPIATDEDRNVVLGYNTTDSTIVGVGIVSQKDIPDFTRTEILAPLLLSDYTGSGPLYPIVTDTAGNVILGYDSAAKRVVGVDDQLTGSFEEQPLSDKPVPAATNHLISYGQSLSIGALTGPVISTTQPYSNVTFSGGPRANNGTTYIYSPLKPLVEDNNNFPADAQATFGETVCSGAANFALSLAASQNGIIPSSHVILASAAGKGGYSIAQLKKGSTWYNDRFLPHVNQGKALSAGYAVHAFCWLQGEQDQALQTSFNTYSSELEQLQQDIETDVKAITGQTSGVYCITYQLSSRLTGTFNGNNRAVPLAQLSLAQTNPKFALAAPCYHLPLVDGVHFTSVGSKWMGAYIGRCYKKIVFDGVTPPFLNPVSATRRGAVIRVRFQVPVGPLVFDTTTLASTTDYGFKVLDGASTATISSLAIDGNDVVITLASTPTGTVKVRYALDYLGVGVTISSGASGNLRDSDPEAIVISGVSRPLYNVCPHFELTAITLGE